MTVRKLDDGKPRPWLAEVYPQGRDGPRKRKRFATKGEAQVWEKWLLEESNSNPWLTANKVTEDKRRLSDIIEQWYRLHGQTLVAGDQVRRKLDLMAGAMGDPYAADFTKSHFAAYREGRLNGTIIFPGRCRDRAAGPKTVNDEQRLLNAVFGELIRLGEWVNPHPLTGLRKVKTQENEMSFLTAAEIDLLLASCAKSRVPALTTVVKLCLATGARWSEVQGLTRSQVSKYRLTFTQTKSKRNRSVPISPELYELIPKRGLYEGKLFPPCYDAFEYAAENSGVKLPEGQLSHVLRHTFASHFMMNGGNILVLQRILGHSTITMTMRYAHFAPDHLDDAVRLNPLASPHS
ncbi:tyrosine-type recombinase/integrase [Aeromonas veronii]|uniref:phage integrase n=1 Tax=Aeromonas veronii TaxID=654 RepID=UPI00222E11C9|nr:tyrosine-type recombinase/integrase [Aeromonas veronii]UZE60492.1 tyrosine-type recombinase/integrase [Aeromonas veronii]